MNLAHSKSKLFKKTDLFESLPEAAINQVIQGCREIMLKPGQWLFKEGDAGDSMYLIYSGEVTIYKEGRKLATRGPGEYFGEMSMIQSDSRAASVKAAGEVHLLELNQEKFYSKLANRPQTLNALLKTLTGRSREDLQSLGQDQQKLQSQTKLNAWLQDLLDSTKDEIYVFDVASYRIKNVNACAEKNLGYSIEELTHKTLFDLLRDLTQERFEKLTESLNVEKNASILFEDFNQRKDGSSYPIDIKVSLWNIGNHSVYVAVAQNKSDVFELEKIKDEALKANKAKSEFLSMMSHELKTPLNAILGFSQLLELNTEDPLTDRQKEWIKEILNAGKYLLGLIDESLDLGRIEAGKLSLMIEEVDLAELIEEILPLLSPSAEIKGVQVANRIPKNTGFCVLADKSKLKQVLINLISNAIKYNRENGSVVIACEKIQGDFTRISVTDTGWGIPEDKLGNLFETFNRLGAEDTKVEGTGLGLVIVKQLLEHMGGSIAVESSVGKGTRFKIELPPKKKSLAVADFVENPEKQQKTYTLLYIEDNATNVKLVQQILNATANIRMITAEKAVVGIEMARNKRPDLILMDIHLAGMDGVTALKELKTMEETKEIPVIAVTANAIKTDIESYREAGFESFIAKPLEMKSFLEIIHHFLKRNSAV